MIRPSRRDVFAASLAAASTPSISLSAAAAARPAVFGPALDEKTLAAALIPRAQWRPYPAASDRAAWEALPEDIRKGAVEAAVPHLSAEWSVLPATLFLEFRRMGNRSNYEAVRNARRERLRELVVAECIEGKGRFLDQIANGIWLTCEETYWGVPAHIGAQKAGVGLPDAAEPTVDLFAAETSAMLAWIDYLLGSKLDTVSPLLRKRIALEIDRRILTPNFERDDFGWMGLGKNSRSMMNNWTPWINSNWLTSVLLMEPDAKRRVAAVNKIARSLDRFLDSYADDGGCDEGPGYWGRAGASMFDCLELWYSASGGKIDFYSNALVGEIGRYVVRAHIAADWYTNFADASARTSIPADLVYRYGKRIKDENMQLLGAAALRRSSRSPWSIESLGRQIPALFNATTLRAAPAREPLLRDAWMPGIQVMTARERAGATAGFYIAAQGGHNAESHNHNDVGNFIVFADGEPAIIDVGVETYSAKTFSSRRYEIWTMQSGYHNLPTIDGVMQAAGRQYAAGEVAYQSNDEAAELRMSIAKAYPAGAGIKRWMRTMRLERTRHRVVIADEYALQKAPSKLTFTLMTARQPVASPGAVVIGGKVRVAFDGAALAASVEEIKTEDRRLTSVWGNRVYRILLTATRPAAEGRFEVRIEKA